METKNLLKENLNKEEKKYKLLKSCSIASIVIAISSVVLMLLSYFIISSSIKGEAISQAEIKEKIRETFSLPLTIGLVLLVVGVVCLFVFNKLKNTQERKYLKIEFELKDCKDNKNNIYD